MRKPFFQVILTSLVLFTACSKDKKEDDPGGGGGNNDPVTITGTSPEFVFWGDQLTITGTGFSTTKADNFVWLMSDASCETNSQDSTDWKKAEVLSATATQLTIKIPYTTGPGGFPCGPDLGASLRITVKGKPTAISPQLVKTMGFPVPISFCDNYGGGYYASAAARPGDSVLLTYAGLGLINLHNSGNQSKIRLMVGNKSIPVKIRPGVSGCGTWGLTFKLELLDFGAAACSPLDPAWSLAGKKNIFKLSLEGVSQSAVTKEFFVANLPYATYTGFSGPAQVSKSAGGNPFWTVTGKNMHYHRVRFDALAPCTGTSGEVSTVCNSFCDQFSFDIPLSLLNAGCTYSVRLIDQCGSTKLIGSVKINP